MANDYYFPEPESPSFDRVRMIDRGDLVEGATDGDGGGAVNASLRQLVGRTARNAADIAANAALDGEQAQAIAENAAAIARNAAAIARNAAAIEENRTAAETVLQSGGYSQITKLNVAQMRTLEIPTAEDASFIRPPVEVLKLRDDGISEAVTACSFNNGDKNDFSDNTFIAFSGGVMLPKTRYKVSTSEPVILGAGHISATVPIDPAIYKTITGVDVV